VVCNTALRHHAFPTSYASIVSECQHTTRRHTIWEQASGPTCVGGLPRPSLLAISCEAVNKDDASHNSVTSHIIVYGILYITSLRIKEFLYPDRKSFYWGIGPPPNPHPSVPCTAKDAEPHCNSQVSEV
jgi:hypothetical protein